MDTDPDRYSLAAIKRQLADGTKLPSPSEINWLIEELEYVIRVNRALDREMARQEAELKAKDREFSAAESEMLDHQDRAIRLEQDLEAARAELDAIRQADAPQSCEHACPTASPL